MDQIKQQNIRIDDVVVSCGSGGTVAGLAAGFALANANIKVYGMCACDDAAYFHDYINREIFQPLGTPFTYVVVYLIELIDDTNLPPHHFCSTDQNRLLI